MIKGASFPCREILCDLAGCRICHLDLGSFAKNFHRQKHSEIALDSDQDPAGVFGSTSFNGGLYTDWNGGDVMINIVVALLAVLAIILVIFLICREIVCWYWKVNEIVALLTDIRGFLSAQYYGVPPPTHTPKVGDEGVLQENGDIKP